MSDQNSQEPTMEEILASIRRIISEDEAPAAAPEAPAAVHAPEPSPDPEPEPDHFTSVEDDVLELTDRLDEPAPAMETHGDLDVFPSGGPAPRLAPEPPPEPEETLVSHPAAQTAASAFGALQRQVLMPADGRTLEDVTRELLRPLLKAWLDANLPAIVQAAVEAEVERISRQRR
jgi:cell pole-organizing protein PopZ